MGAKELEYDTGHFKKVRGGHGAFWGGLLEEVLGRIADPISTCVAPSILFLHHTIERCDAFEVREIGFRLSISRSSETPKHVISSTPKLIVATAAFFSRYQHAQPPTHHSPSSYAMRCFHVSAVPPLAADTRLRSEAGAGL